MSLMRDTTDEELVERARQGYEAAFNELVDRHTYAVYRMALGITGVPHEAEDIVQETFLKVFKSLDRFSSSKARFKTWLLTIARNESINLFHALKRKAARFLGEPEHETALSASANGHVSTLLRNPEALLSDMQQFHRVQTAMKSLPERQRTALLLKSQDGLSYAEIAQIMGSSVSSVESLIFRARQKLLETLQSES